MENIKELLDEWRQLSLEEQETKLNDYLLENKDKLYDEELIEILRYGIDLKDNVCEVTDPDEEEVNYAVTLNDSVFLRLWLARLYASDPDLETEGEALVEKSMSCAEILMLFSLNARRSCAVPLLANTATRLQALMIV